ncbi:hypothetical protein R6Q59_001950 [Mikania micrantha]|uniref:Uncharacterized protein n=1 Tax=Mikania micrantha TaxID=192012 RepID=A0A5N6NLZ7_9ASTR|nr:hypothetical protein E3N88_19022 [Mikania micrantha]
MEFNSIPFTNSVHNFLTIFSYISSHPLFSTIVTLYTLILIYAPSFFLGIVVSPVFNSAGIILLFLLKLGANEKSETESDYLESRVFDHTDKHYEHITSLEQRFLDLVESHQKQTFFNQDLGLEFNSHDDYSLVSSHVVERVETRMEMSSNQVDTTMNFHKWNMKAPLEIIYEAYEGVDEEDDDDDDDDDNENMVCIDKHLSKFDNYPSLSTYYSESETDSSSDDDFLMIKNLETYKSMFSKWEDYDREELMEISIDYKKKNIEFCLVDEDNLIEIEIFPRQIEV